MATCLNYNCEALGDHEVATLTCKGPRPAGISEVVLILCGNDLTDPSDGTEVNALIAAGDAKLVQQIRMGIGQGESTLSLVDQALSKLTRAFCSIASFSPPYIFTTPYSNLLFIISI